MYIETTNSTNTLLREYIANGNPPQYIYTGFQTAGRGQTGNGWESQKGKNLLCSILLPPTEMPFMLNVAVSVAVHRAISEIGINDVTIKWPNDIYWKDKKIAGILIENAIIGNKIVHSIAGIGLNINQTEWLSNAPNPVSLTQITGETYDIHQWMQRIWNQVQQTINEDTWTYYKSHLYRRDGLWPFIEREVTTAPTMNADNNAKGQFMACIEDILPSGELVLRDQQNKLRTYHFKQIRYVLYIL